MDELENKIPVDSWRKTFEEAAEAPPSRVWDTIEQRLSESADTKVVPLWGIGVASSRPLLWATGVAATVTLLLVGWWLMPGSTAGREGRLSLQRRTAQAVTIRKENELTALSASKTQKNPAFGINPIPKFAGTAGTQAPKIAHNPSVSLQKNQLSGPIASVLSVNAIETLVSDALQRVGNVQVSTTHTLAGRSLVSYAATNLFTPESQSLSGLVELEPLKMLSGKPIRLREISGVRNVVWLQPASELAGPEMSKSQPKKRDLWASAGVMFGAFNPMVSVPSASSSAKNTSLVANQTQSVRSQSAFSVAYQINVGKQLTDHWSVETGVGYLAGRSTVDTPAPVASNVPFVANDPSKTNGSLFVDALRNSVTGQMASTNLDQLNLANNAYTTPQSAYSDQNRKVLTTNYQFVQVPVQVGYQLRPRKRLNLAVLGGIISNIFVRNSVNNEVVITEKDDVYRPVSFAALVGARFRYQHTPQWSASLAGIYQPSIGLISQAHSQVQSQPTTAGMTLGVDYHF